MTQETKLQMWRSDRPTDVKRDTHKRIIDFYTHFRIVTPHTQSGADGFESSPQVALGRLSLQKARRLYLAVAKEMGEIRLQSSNAFRRNAATCGGLYHRSLAYNNAGLSCPRHRRIEQVPVKHTCVFVRCDYDHHWELATLGLMDRRDTRVDQMVAIAMIKIDH
jgi:hypothetical protein